jgi:light-harvesting complex I chlorophyll a/b binding protein 1
VSLFELINGAALYDQAKGSGRKAGEFNFDPLGLGKNPNNFKRYAASEVKNGRLAMLAFAGIVTQSALFPDKSFPFF